jgi:hypothetical protein
VNRAQPDKQPRQHELRRCNGIGNGQRAANGEEEDGNLEQVSEIVGRRDVLEHTGRGAGRGKCLRIDSPRADLGDARDVHAPGDERNERYLCDQRPEYRVTHGSAAMF